MTNPSLGGRMLPGSTPLASSAGEYHRREYMSIKLGRFVIFAAVASTAACQGLPVATNHAEAKHAPPKWVQYQMAPAAAPALIDHKEWILVPTPVKVPNSMFGANLTAGAPLIWDEEPVEGLYTAGSDGRIYKFAQLY